MLQTAQAVASMPTLMMDTVNVTRDTMDTTALRHLQSELHISVVNVIIPVMDTVMALSPVTAMRVVLIPMWIIGVTVHVMMALLEMVVYITIPM